MLQSVIRVWVLQSALILLHAFSQSEVENHGLGAQYDWVDWPLPAAEAADKPVMVVIHKPHCPACKNLKAWFSQSQDILRLSGQFSMVNIVSGTKEAPQLEVDGRYVPRIYFLDSQGNVLQHIVNPKGNPAYKYFYFDEASVVESMRTVLETETDTVQQEAVPEKEL